MKKGKHKAAHQRRRDRKHFSRQEGNELKQCVIALAAAMQKIGSDFEIIKANTERNFKELCRTFKRRRKQFYKNMNGKE